MTESLHLVPHDIRESSRRQLLQRRERLHTAAHVQAAPALIGLLAEVDAALERLEGDSFGLCAVCEGLVEEERLICDPTARVCLECLSPSDQRAWECDLELAARIQGGLLPERSQAGAGWEVHYEYRPLGVVSGDYCDLIPSSSRADEILFVLGDVSGKGLSAGLLMANLQAIFRGLAATDLALTDIMERANSVFCNGTLASSFATAVAGRLEPDGALTICNAGHAPPLLDRGGEVVPVGSSGLPLGMFCSGCFASERFELEPGDRLFLYTDGLTEAVNEGDEEFGLDRARSAFAGGGRTARETVRAALEQLENHRRSTPATDDLTLMAIRRTG